VCRRLLEDVLADQPYELTLTKNGQEALRAFADDQPDILILDWMMPGLSGPELCRLVRNTCGLYTYIILITSSSDRNRVIEGLDAGADDYLTKPFEGAWAEGSTMSLEKAIHYCLDEPGSSIISGYPDQSGGVLQRHGQQEGPLGGHARECRPRLVRGRRSTNYPR
jgi:CheY-like chemotaxis protein